MHTSRVLAAFGLALFGALAHAQYIGTWKGTTNQGQPLDVSVVTGGVKQLRWGVQIGGCTSVNTTTLGTPAAITNSSFNYSSSGVTTLTIPGTFASATNASGTLAYSLSNQYVGGCVGTLSTTWTATRAMLTAVFRDTAGAIQLNNHDSTSLISGGGVFGSDPASAEDSQGNTFVAARDTFGSLWASVFNASTQTWSAWHFAGGLIQGTPAVAVANGTAYIAVRDQWNSYWILSYSAAGTFGTWTPLQGIFSTDPVIAAVPDGSLYLIGKDTWNSLWSGQFIPASGFQGWQFGGGIVQGKPSVTGGGDGYAYVAIRDNWNSLWAVRVSGSAWDTWYYAGGIMSGDPQVVADGTGMLFVVLKDSGNGVWYRKTSEGSPSTEYWYNWTNTGGLLSDFSAAAVGGELYVAGRDSTNKIWWRRDLTNEWTLVGQQGIAAGPLSAAPH